MLKKFLGVFLILFGIITVSYADISNNSGGSIGMFAIQTMKYKRSGELVRITGRCDSACTMFLSIPNLCVTANAYFRFHAPRADNPVAAHVAKQYLMKQYPAWVRAFIANHGGLTDRLIVMQYKDIKNHIRTCK